MDIKTDLATCILGGLLANPNYHILSEKNSETTELLIRKAFEITNKLLELADEERKNRPKQPLPTPMPSEGKIDRKGDYFTRRDY